GHEVDAVRQVLPRTGHPLDIGLATQPALGSDLAGDAGDFRGERAKLIHHGINDVLDLKNLAAHVHGELLCQVAGGDCGGDLGDVAQLHRQIAGHQIHVVREVLPGAGDALDVGLAAQLPFRTDFAGDAGDFGGEGAELVHHGVDGVLQL